MKIAEEFTHLGENKNMKVLRDMKQNNTAVGTHMLRKRWSSERLSITQDRCPHTPHPPPRHDQKDSPYVHACVGVYICVYTIQQNLKTELKLGLSMWVLLFIHYLLKILCGLFRDAVSLCLFFHLLAFFVRPTFSFQLAFCYFYLLANLLLLACNYPFWFFILFSYR